MLIVARKRNDAEVNFLGVGDFGFDRADHAGGFAQGILDVVELLELQTPRFEGRFPGVGDVHELRQCVAANAYSFRNSRPADRVRLRHDATRK